MTRCEVLCITKSTQGDEKVKKEKKTRENDCENVSQNFSNFKTFARQRTSRLLMKTRHASRDPFASRDVTKSLTSAASGDNARRGSAGFNCVSLRTAKLFRRILLLRQRCAEKCQDTKRWVGSRRFENGRSPVLECWRQVPHGGTNGLPWNLKKRKRLRTYVLKQKSCGRASPDFLIGKMSIIAN